MTRAEFLRTVAVGAGAAIPGMTAFGAQDGEHSGGAAVDASRLSPMESNRLMAEKLTKEAFSNCLHSKFRILDKSSPTVIEAELVEVHEGRSSAQHEQFSVLFAGPCEPCLPQRTYEVEHAAMGSFDLFLVPIGADQDGTRYEAVFNRLLT
ncbi:MAG: DUF6916 family protein [Planctomycetota bacterium]